MNGTTARDALAVRDLCVAYGKVPAVRDVSLQVAPGSIVTVIGPNGAGKTTLLGAIAGLLPARGAVRCFGEIATAWPVEERVRRGIVLVPERRELFGSMSVADNLRLGAFTRPASAIADSLADVHARFPVLAARRRAAAGTLSGGQQQMLAIGRALMAKPRLLLLDEPSLGLAPLLVQEIFREIARINRDEGTTILLVEQNAHAALAIADRAYVLETGRVVLTGPGRELAADPKVREAYLGVAPHAHRPPQLEGVPT